MEMGLIEDEGHLAINVKLTHNERYGWGSWWVRYGLEYDSKRERKILKYEGQVKVEKDNGQNVGNPIHLMEDNLDEIEAFIIKIDGTTTVGLGKMFCINDE